VYEIEQARDAALKNPLYFDQTDRLEQDKSAEAAAKQLEEAMNAEADAQARAELEAELGAGVGAEDVQLTLQ
jgi:hypothetical protein